MINKSLNGESTLKKDFKKLVRFKLSVKGSDVSKDLKGKEIGNQSKNMEKNNYLNEIFGFVRNLKIQGYLQLYPSN